MLVRQTTAQPGDSATLDCTAIDALWISLDTDGDDLCDKDDIPSFTYRTGSPHVFFKIDLVEGKVTIENNEVASLLHG